jgi:hypothetical protein
MRPASVLGYPSFGAYPNTGVIHTRLAHIKIVHIRFLLISVGNRRTKRFAYHFRGTLPRKLQNIQRVLHLPARYQLRN